MALTLLPFPQTDWAPGASTDLERKKVIGDAGAILLEFAPGFIDPSWCSNGHVGFVLEGEICFELDGSRKTVRGGEGFLIDAGTRHRAFNPGKRPVRLFLVSNWRRPDREGG